MRKFILSTLALAALASPLAAQPAPGELRDDRREIRQERGEIRGDLARGDYREAREDRRDLRDARQELRDDRRERFDDRRDDRRGYDGDRRRWDGDRRGYDGRRYDAGRYYHPRGYGYRTWAVGGFLPRAYWGDRYYIGRPAFYGLPVAYRGARWVRVGPDALLIRIRDGAVLRVERARFY